MLGESKTLEWGFAMVLHRLCALVLFASAKYFMFVSFLLYPTEVKRLKCTMLGEMLVRKNYDTVDFRVSEKSLYSAVPL